MRSGDGEAWRSRDGDETCSLEASQIITTSQPRLLHSPLPNPHPSPKIPSFPSSPSLLPIAQLISPISFRAYKFPTARRISNRLCHMAALPHDVNSIQTPSKAHLSSLGSVQRPGSDQAFIARASELGDRRDLRAGWSMFVGLSKAKWFGGVGEEGLDSGLELTMLRWALE